MGIWHKTTTGSTTCQADLEAPGPLVLACYSL